jgi:hypothetical protein
MSEEQKDGGHGFPPEVVERVKSDARNGVQQLVNFVEKAEMPLLVVFALDNSGGTALAWTNAPLEIADDIARRSMHMLAKSESEKADAVKH